jgi:hypothetical protein
VADGAMMYLHFFSLFLYQMSAMIDFISEKKRGNHWSSEVSQTSGEPNNFTPQSVVH